MASIKATAGNQLVFIPEEGAQPQLLLDCSDPMANCSSLPLFPGRNDPRPSLLQLTAGYMEQCRRDPACAGHELGFSLLLCLLANELQHRGGPVRVLEYGCGDGSLSPLLSALIAAFDRRSSLYCLSDGLSARWPERMAQVPQGPQVKYLVSRYGDSGLREGSFDLVVLNGSGGFRDPQAPLREAGRLLADDGLLLCYRDHDPLLDSLTELYFLSPAAFRLDAHRQVTAVPRAKLSPSLMREDPEEADRLPEEVRHWLDSEPDEERGQALARSLDRAIREAAARDLRRQKQQLLDAREALLNRLLTLEPK